MLDIKEYRKTATIKAVKLTHDNLDDVAAWCGGTSYRLAHRGDHGEDISHVTIKTLEGTMRADLGDWVAKGIQGEFWPIKPDVFAASYEAVDFSMVAGK